MTHGPAIRTSGLPVAKSLKLIGTAEERLLFKGPPPHVLPIRRADELFEQRMRLHRLRFELGMELAAEEPRVVRDLADLDVRPVRRFTREPQPAGLQLVFVFPIELVAVAMPLVDIDLAVGAMSEAAFREMTRPASEAHGAA